MNLISESLKFKVTAQKVLKESHLLELLSSYGKVQPVGAYQFDLMLSGDIDLHVYVKKLDKVKVVEVFNKLIVQEYFRACMLDDFVKWSDPRFPRGYYLGLRVVPDGYDKDKRWKIDVWFIEKDSQEGKKNFERLKNISDVQRETILVFKNYRKQNSLDFPSIVIYDAVFEEGITNLSDFIKYLSVNSR